MPYSQYSAAPARVLKDCVSALAIAACLWSMQVPARATDYNGTNGPLLKTSKSSDGKKFDTTFWPWQDDIPATPGNPGGSMDDRNFGVLGDSARQGTQVQLWSTGGKGGDGGYVGHFPMDAAGGGDGGTLLFEQYGQIITKGPQTAMVLRGEPLISLFSQGGAGGETGSSIPLGPIVNAEANGGKGGNGGAVTLKLGASTSTMGNRYPVAIASSRGGGGGGGNSTSAINAGGDGGDVTINLLASGSAGTVTISTDGKRSPALIAESLGGAGGKSGVLSLRKKARGGTGGNGGAVSFKSDAGTVLETHGAASAAVVLQTAGGRGGDAQNTNRKGGNGGDGGNIQAYNYGEISTDGEFSFGIVAQSVSGDGGLGASSWISGSDGGRAGKAGEILIENHGTMTTKGDGSVGVIAQSIGGGDPMDAFDSTKGTYTPGGGGNGGQVGWGSFFGGSGGDGGQGANGGTVNVHNHGFITTQGIAAYGIQVQSIGGNGGQGGGATNYSPLISIAIGGNGGGGGDGGKVRAGLIADATRLAATGQWSDSYIHTTGDAAIAILAQSVGGGGGAGGASSSNSGSAVIPSISVAIGGSGGKGGKGGNVDVGNSTNIVTRGNSAVGILAQSIGGGGGLGGGAEASSIAISGDKIPAVAIPVSVGGSGGEGGDGARVRVTNAAMVETYGDDSSAIEAQSIGGGGGSGGNASSYALAIQATGSMPAIDASVAVGGSGDTGGDGGEVIGVNLGYLSTSGGNSSALVARSIGGGGGIGGSASSTGDLIAFANGISASVAIGGSGKGGGQGGKVTADNQNEIHTRGDYSYGVYAGSIGGGGGSGGTADAASKSGLSADWFSDYGIEDLWALTGIDGDFVTANVAIGGAGAKGGNGGDVTVSNSGIIVTEGVNSSAILARSIGGGGGDGGGFQGGGSTSIDVNVSIGGSGGKGGKGGTVSVTNTNGISTRGNGAHGIVASSLGGGGGDGGSFTGDTSDSLSFDSIGDAFASIAEGVVEAAKVSKGLDKDGTVTGYLTQAKTVASIFKDMQDTYENADLSSEDADLLAFTAKMMAQGFAGLTQVFLGNTIEKLQEKLKDSAGGGNGLDLPSISANLSVGGSGNTGGDGGSVTVDNRLSIHTTGELAFGVFAQSIGGGGGTGGIAYASGQQTLNATVAIGGSGGAAGKGGSVEVRNSGTIRTGDTGSVGILAQSVGGGGGLGGAASTDNTLSFSVSVGLGGNDGATGDGGNVEVTNSGVIQTKGAEAHGIMAQSIGGGGGFYSVNFEDALSQLTEEAVNTTKADIEAYLQESNRSSAQSSAVADLVAQAQAITKDLVEQSGTLASQTSGGTAAYNDNTTALPTPKITVTMGGKGGAGGSGGEVSVSNTGSISTTGEGAIGLFAQSIGGGGGAGKNASAGGSVLLLTDWVFGGAGGASGDGGNINLSFGPESRIQTTGDGAHAVLAQTIGGGGGYGGVATLKGLYDAYTIFDNLVAQSGSSGNGGDITVTMSASEFGPNIYTDGEQAHGIYAQSLGGGGGAITAVYAKDGPTPGNANVRSGSIGNGGAISITTEGTIWARGQDSHGIFAQSGFQQTDGSLHKDLSRGGDISIETHGRVFGGSGNGAAIYVDGGTAKNVVTVAEGSEISAASGRAIVGTYGNEEVNNHGVIVGDIDLDGTIPAERNWFNNYGSYASVDAGIVNLGYSSGHAFRNYGTFRVGSRNAGDTVTVNGNLYIEAGGTLVLDVNRDGEDLVSDFVTVTRDTTFADGSEIMIDLHPYASLENGDSFAVLKTGRTLQLGDVDVTEGSPLLWHLSSDGTMNSGYKTLVLTVEGAAMLGAAPRALTATEFSMLTAWQSAWDSEDEDAGLLFGDLATIDSSADYAVAIDSASPESTMQPVAEMTLASRDSMSAAQSCPDFPGVGTAMDEAQCAWGNVTRGHSSLSDGAAADGFDSNTQTLRIGGQWALADDWHLGATLGVTDAWGHSSDGMTRTSGTSGDVSLALKHQWGAWQFAGVAQAGYGSNDIATTVDIGDEIWMSEASTDVTTAALRARAAYQLSYEGWYLRPSVEVDAIHTQMDGYDLKGASFDQHVEGMSEWIFAAHPSIELGLRHDIDADSWLRSYARAGVTLVSDDALETGVTVTRDGGEAFAFRSEAAIPDRLFDVGFGMQFNSGENYDLRGEFSAEFADGYVSQQAAIRMSLRF